MPMNEVYAPTEPTRAEVDAIAEPVVVEFGSPYCHYCAAAQPLIAAAFADRPGIRHIKIHDGKGRRLGRSFKVKLWPTLVFLQAGREVARVVRPGGAGTIRQALERLEASD